MIVLEFLKKMVPFRDWIYLAAALALFVGYEANNYHQRQIQKGKDDAAALALVAAKTVHDKEVEDRAAVLVKQAGDALRAQLAAPPIAPVHVRVCLNTPADVNTGSANAGAGPGNDGPPDLSEDVGPENAGEGPDIGPETDQLLDNADAQVKALQEYIRICQSKGICRKI